MMFPVMLALRKAAVTCTATAAAAALHGLLTLWLVPDDRSALH
jgi:hypothetical protein